MKSICHYQFIWYSFLVLPYFFTKWQIVGHSIWESSNIPIFFLSYRQYIYQIFFNVSDRNHCYSINYQCHQPQILIFNTFLKITKKISSFFSFAFLFWLSLFFMNRNFLNHFIRINIEHYFACYFNKLFKLIYWVALKYNSFLIISHF